MRGVRALSSLEGSLQGSVELAAYCDYFLRQAEAEEEEFREMRVASGDDTVRRDFPALVVTQLLAAMRLDSAEARKRFPRLLQIMQLYGPSAVDAFVANSGDIPCWMFLAWLSQMTGLLDKPEGKAVHRILENTSNEYPQVGAVMQTLSNYIIFMYNCNLQQAFIYPFKISAESYKLDGLDEEQQEFIER